MAVSVIKNRVCGRGTFAGVALFIGAALLLVVLLALCAFGVPWLALVSWNFFASAAGFSTLIVPVSWKTVLGLAAVFAALRLAFMAVRRQKAE